MFICPKCGARMLLSSDRIDLWCQFCGKRYPNAVALEQFAQFKAQRDQQLTDYEPVAGNETLSSADRQALTTAWQAIQNGDPVTARHVLEESLALWDNPYTYADGWYLFSLTTDDLAEKLRYLDYALAITSNHQYAWLDRVVLGGGISAAAAAVEPEPARADMVEAESETQQCPLCGGLLAYSVTHGALICRSCSYRPDVGSVAMRSYDKLEKALWQRRFGFTKEWHVGARLLVCQNCHAQLTLTSSTLAAQCPFCDSAHVLEEDAVDSFEEPDALLPFKIDRRAAARALHQRMPEQLRGKVERGDSWGVYLPFWSFEGVVTLGVSADVLLRVPLPLGTYDVEEFLVGGITRPVQAVLYELMPFHLADLVPYDPRYLGSSWLAQVYNVDVVQASLTARAYAKYVVHRKTQSVRYEAPPLELARTDSKAYNTPAGKGWYAVQTDISGLRYRLLLLPVWLITLHLSNGARLPGVVNGQTGEALLSASFRSPETIIAGPGRDPIVPLSEILPLPRPRVQSDVIRPISLLKPATTGVKPPHKSIIRPLPLDD